MRGGSVFAWLSADDGRLRLALLCAVLAVVAIVLLVALVRTERRRRVESSARASAIGDRADADLELAEQQSRVHMAAELLPIALQRVAQISVRAEGAAATARLDAEVTERAIETVLDDAREAVSTLRRLGDVLEVPDQSIDVGLDSMPRLFDRARAAGLDVDVVESGERFPLTPGAGVMLHRVVEAALENALAHGGAGTTVRVATTWADPGVQVLVEDDGERAAARRAGIDESRAARSSISVTDDLLALTDTFSGVGLTEMRARVELFGGVCQVEQLAGVGFSVRFAFPSLRHRALV